MNDGPVDDTMARMRKTVDRLTAKVKRQAAALERAKQEARVKGMRAALDELRTLHKSMAHFLRVETWEGYKQGVTDAENAIRSQIEAERGE